MAISVPVASDIFAVTHHRAMAAGRAIFTPALALAIDSRHNNGIFLMATDGIVLTLPLCSTLDPGFMITVVACLATTTLGFVITPNVADTLWGTILSSAAGGAVSTQSGTAGHSIRLTKGTQKVADWVTLVSNGLTDWHIVGGIGIYTFS